MALYSVLDFRDSWRSVDAPAATVIALHGKGDGLAELVLGDPALGDRMRWVAPIAARGIYQGVDNVGRTWFGGSLARPEPASFGDSLAQLERFLYDDRNRSARWPDSLPWLLGYDQGAVLGLALALTLPEMIAGVIAVRGALPQFNDSSLLAANQLDMPIFLANAPEDPAFSEAHQQETVRRLQTLGGVVTSAHMDSPTCLGPECTGELSEWFSRHSMLP